MPHHLLVSSSEIVSSPQYSSMKLAIIRSVAAGFILIFLMAFSNDSKTIERCIESELKLHGESHLVDLYKYFFQDFFGPGHLVSGREGPEAYLENELAEAKSFEPFDYQELLYSKQFVRVNLRMVANNDITKKQLLDAFMQSAREFKLPDISKWRKKWTRIAAVIKELHPNLPGIAEESTMIDSLLLSGDYVVHHSQEYINAYHPHYRIIERKIFEKQILNKTKPQHE